MHTKTLFWVAALSFLASAGFAQDGASYEPAPVGNASQTPTELPKTGSSAPRMALAGVALMASGFFVARRVG